MRCDLSYKAEQDVLNIAKYLKKKDGGLVEEFYNELNETRKMLIRFPEIGSFVSDSFKQSHEQLKQVRFWLMSKFHNYAIFYQKDENNLIILRIIHIKQDIPTVFDN